MLERRCSGLRCFEDQSIAFKSFTANVYAFMYALQNKCWFIFTMCEILYAQLVPPVGLEPTLEGFYLLPVLLITPTEIGLEVTFEIPSVTGSAVASTVTGPRTEGLQGQVAVKLEPEPLAVLFLHPGITLPLALNVTLDATVTVAEIATDVLKVAVVAAPASWNKVKAALTITSS